MQSHVFRSASTHASRCSRAVLEPVAASVSCRPHSTQTTATTSSVASCSGRHLQHTTTSSLQQHALQQPSRRTVLVRAASQDAAAAEEAVVSLSNLESSPIVNEQGLVNPVVPGHETADYKAFVFAVYDEQMKIQYTGFSTDLRNSLRTLMGRRPDKARYFKVIGLPELNQDRMLKIRNTWYEQMGGAPNGNKLPMERNMWQNPVDAGAISARGKRGAAEEQCRQLQDQLKLLGCTEEFTPNEQLLEEGLVDFLPVGGISEETANALKASQQEAKQRTRKSKATIDGVDQSFEVRYDSILKTNGGFMVDCAVNIDNRLTKHRVVVGLHYVEGQGLSSPEIGVESAIGTLLQAKLSRQTEGLISMGMFPINYFSVANAEQWFPEEFARAFTWNAGKPYVPEVDDETWRFTRKKSYGAAFVDEQARIQREKAQAQAQAEREEDEKLKREQEAEDEAAYAEGAV